MNVLSPVPHAISTCKIFDFTNVNLHAPTIISVENVTDVIFRYKMARNCNFSGPFQILPSNRHRSQPYCICVCNGAIHQIQIKDSIE